MSPFMTLKRHGRLRILGLTVGREFLLRADEVIE